MYVGRVQIRSSCSGVQLAAIIHTTYPEPFTVTKSRSVCRSHTLARSKLLLSRTRAKTAQQACCDIILDSTLLEASLDRILLLQVTQESHFIQSTHDVC